MDIDPVNYLNQFSAIKLKFMVIGIDIRSLAGGAYTGIGEYTSNLLRHMTAPDLIRGMGLGNIRFKLFFNAKNQKPDVRFLENRKNIEFYFFRYPNKYFSLTTRLLGLPKVDNMIGGADVFFNPHFIFSPVTRRCKTVITFHDLSFEHYPEFFDTKRKIWHFSNFPEEQAKSAARLIAASRSTASDLYNIYKIDPRKIFVIYSGINKMFFEDEFPEKLKKIKSKYYLPDNFILFLSTIEPRKNAVSAIKAFELFQQLYADKSNGVKSDVKLVIAGKPGWLYNEIFQTIRHSKFRKDIVYAGFIDDDDKPGLYRLAKLFVYPSIYEGFGFPPLEAMASGTPVITSRISSLPEIVGDAALLVNPFDIQEIAKAMTKVIESASFSDELRERGIMQAAKFSWTKCAEDTLKVLVSSV